MAGVTAAQATRPRRKSLNMVLQDENEAIQFVIRKSMTVRKSQVRFGVGL
jgi:hypothetical protein